jgi:hypothetical protein
MTNKIPDKLVSDWVEKFDGNDAEVLLTAIANNEIKIEVMVDSIYAYHIGETEVARELYKEMFK